MALYRERGIVLRTIKLGEADRIITIATEGRGKVRAVAKGVRKTKSRFGARLEPLMHVSLQLYEGRELDTVTQAETIDAFRAIREDLDRLTQATALLEAIDHVVQEREENPRLVQMLLGALRTLEAGPAPLVIPAFFWKLLATEGFHPLLDECSSCGEADVEYVAFDLDSGGVLCRSCARSAPRLSAGGLVLLRRILGGDLVSVLAEPASAAGYEVEHLATRALEAHVERRMRSMHLLDRS
jgi:DNA repair protein RecO (recombination protein O)